MPYVVEGLGAAIGTRPKGPLAAAVERIRATSALIKTPVFTRPNIAPIAPPIPVLKMPNTGITPILKPPVVDYMPIMPTPEVMVSQGVPYSPQGGGPITGAPSPVLQLAPDADSSGDSTPLIAGMSPVMMLVLAGLAFTFLLKKR